MSRSAWMASVVVVVALVAGFYWYAGSQRSLPVEQALAPAPVPPPAEVAAGSGDAAVAYPLPATTDQEQPALPPLAASDSHVRDALTTLFGKTPLESLLIPDQLLRRFVVTVDSLDGDPIPLRQRPLRHVPGMLVVERSGERILLSAENGRRYTPFVRMLQAADPQRLVDLYLRYYPLLQKAYTELGYPDRYFNDRLVEVIDHLLQSPEVAGPIELVQPEVMYEFADRDLERRSFGAKILIRMGEENAGIVRRQLRAIREDLVQRSVQPSVQS